MGFFDRFKNTRNYAEDFREAYENHNMVKLNLLMEKWNKKGSHDGLFGLARVIYIAQRHDKTWDEAVEIYESSIKEECDNPDLLKWYNQTALELLDTWAREDDNSEKDEQFSDAESKIVSNVNFSRLGCRNFASTFKQLYDELSTADNSQISLYMSKFNELLTSWEKKCPDDSNFISAYVMIHSLELSPDELRDYADKYASAKAYDKSLKEWFDEGMDRVISTIE